ncbi:hypothetical protein F-S17_0060 [Faustovirus]|nr:hypothetical protein F-LCD7_0075 [Faustovirus]QJX71839.1 hypothetical protein F-M6_0076 [Faustovirus]QJX72326.1 hypothetical protein F-S17_0060 [Faustovirus]QJX72836.1 hypothetical protein F-VV57_0074 [Faustovirus]QJX73342.1 hypothetical protein F-VV63_0076 [Faustovirus]
MEQIPAKFKFIDNGVWNPEDANDDENDAFVQIPNSFWVFVRGMNWDEFTSKKATAILNIGRYSQLQRDTFVKFYSRLMRSFMAAYATIIPDHDERVMLGSHFIALGHDHFNNAMNDEELVKNIHTAETYGNFNGSLPNEMRYIHIHMRPNA